MSSSTKTFPSEGLSADAWRDMAPTTVKTLITMRMGGSPMRSWPATKRIRISNSNLSHAAGISKPTCIRAIRELRRLQLIRVIEDGDSGNGGTLYEVLS